MSDFYWEELAGTLFDEAGDALFLFDPESEQVREVNPMAQRLSGYTRRELQEMKITYLFRSEQEGGVQRLRHAFRRTGLFHSQEGFWLRHKTNHSWVPVNLTITRLHIEPKTIGLITARDITERHQAHALLQKTDAELRRVMSSVSDCLWSAEINAEGQWIYRFVSPVVETITGRKPDFYIKGGIGQWMTTVHPDDRSRMANVRDQLRHGQAIQDEYRVVRPDGSFRWVRTNVAATTLPEGRGYRLDGILSDITDRKLYEQALQASEAKYRSLIENLTQSIFLKDRDLRYVTANKQFCLTLGLTEEELVGKDDLELYPAELADRYRAADRLVLQEGRRLELEEQNLISGQLRTVQKMKMPVLDENGLIIGVLGIFWDVTDQRNLEAQVRQAHKMEAVGQLAGGIAHDFNNLLTGILGNLALALADLPDGHPCRDLLTSAETAGFRAADLIRQLLSFSRRAPLQPVSLNLNTSIDETVRLLRSTLDPRIILNIKAEPKLWQIQADASQISQVLMNLCLNARDAMPQGGNLTLETANVRLDRDRASVSLDGRPGDFVHLCVSDNGQGMPPEVREHIFEPFFTTKEPGKGTGLGLAMVFGIVKQHGGWIECTSAVGQGTYFDIYLPRLAAPKAAPAAIGTIDGVRGGKETILLADDEEMVGRLGETTLKRHGYQVLIASDGTEALDVYRRRGRDIDLVILDLSMPKLSGPDTLRELRKINPTVHVLISSGFCSDEDRLTIEKEGIAGFVAKPYRPADLARKVREVLDRAGSTRQAGED